MIFLPLPELLHIAGHTLGPEYSVRDCGLLGAALTTTFGKDTYPTLDAKPAATLHSLARNHALTEGSKQLALAALIASTASTAAAASSQIDAHLRMH